MPQVYWVANPQTENNLARRTEKPKVDASPVGERIRSEQDENKSNIKCGPLGISGIGTLPLRSDRNELGAAPFLTHEKTNFETDSI